MQFFLLLPEQLFGLLERPCLFFQPAVAFRELLLLALQFSARACDCFSNFFGSHRRFNRVQHDADAFRQLIEEREVDVVEALERREFDDGLHIAFEQDRQDDDVVWRGFAQAGVDLDVIAGDVRDEDALLLERALADEAFPGWNSLVSVLRS